MNRYGILLLMVLAFSVGACGGGGDLSTPTITPRPTLTATRLSTPLPYLPTPIPAGFPENPLQIVLVPANLEAAQANETAFEAELLAQTGVTVDIVLATRTAEVVTALCRSGSERVSLAWVDVLGYASAIAQGCGEATLKTVEQSAGVVLIARRLETSSLAQLASRTFCRLGYDDFYSWVLPTLILQSEGVAPEQLGQVRDFDTVEALLQAVTDTACDAIGLPEQDYDRLLSEGNPLINDLRLATRSVELPHGVLVVPPLVPLGNREALLQGLRLLSQSVEPTGEATAEVTPEATAETAEQSGLFTVFFGDSAWQDVSATTFDSLDRFFESTGINFATLGH